MKDFISLITAVAVITLLSLGIFCFGGSAGVGLGRELTRQEAVDAGAGKWTIDPHTGKAGFEWVTQSR